MKKPSSSDAAIERLIRQLIDEYGVDESFLRMEVKGRESTYTPSDIEGKAKTVVSNKALLFEIGRRIGLSCNVEAQRQIDAGVSAGKARLRQIRKHCAKQTAVPFFENMVSKQ